MSTKQRIIGLSRLLLLVIAVIAAVGFFSGNAEASSSNTPVSFQYVSVGAGQTLWGLAEIYASDEQNKQEWVSELIALNNLTTSTLQPGQRLALPN